MVQSLAEFLGTASQLESSYVDCTDLTVRDFCRGVLQSREYRQSVLDRITLGLLPPAVECKMYDYAYGKPPDRVEHTGKDGRPIESITEVRRVVIHVAADVMEEHSSSKLQTTH